jgi:RNA polymerase sigma factor (sigma-70 family)
VETSVFDEEETKLLLLGDADEVGKGLDLIHQHLKKRVCWRVRHFLPGLKPEDLTDCWQETLTAVFEAASEGRFDADRALGPYLVSIAYRKGIDLLRRLTTRDQALTAVGESLRATKSGRQWQGLSGPERNEAMGLIRDAVSALPRKQRVVLQAFLDHYPETKDMEVLRKEVSRMTGVEETLAAVKRALQEGRNKVRQLLERKGYTFGKRGDA